MDLKTFINTMAVWLSDPSHVRERIAIKEVLKLIDKEEGEK